MHPYRTPAPLEPELAASSTPASDESAFVAFVASLAVVALAITGVGLVWGSQVAGLVATFVTPPFVGLAVDEVAP